MARMGATGAWPGLAARILVLFLLSLEACGLGQQGKVDVASLNPDQLRALHQQLGEEERHLTRSYQQLRSASSGFSDAKQAIK